MCVCVLCVGCIFLNPDLDIMIGASLATRYGTGITGS